MTRRSNIKDTGRVVFQVGDRVAYSAEFCRSIGALTGEIPHLRGTVEAVTPVLQRERGTPCRTLVLVRWEGEGCGTMRVLDSNLAHVGPNSRFCAI